MLVSVQAKNSENCAAPLRLLERSVFSDRMVFVRAVHEAKWLSEMELSIYDSWCVLQPKCIRFCAMDLECQSCPRRMSLRMPHWQVTVSGQVVTDVQGKEISMSV